jgi:hypothetical protein
MSRIECQNTFADLLSGVFKVSKTVRFNPRVG